MEQPEELLQEQGGLGGQGTASLHPDPERLLGGEDTARRLLPLAGALEVLLEALDANR